LESSVSELDTVFTLPPVFASDPRCKGTVAKLPYLVIKNFRSSSKWLTHQIENARTVAAVYDRRYFVCVPEKPALIERRYSALSLVIARP